MVKIRLRRVGARKQPSFRVVVADQRAARDGAFIEKIGVYNPRTEPETLRIDEARALYWLSVGAQPTESVARLLKTTGTMARFERLKEGESLEDLVAEAEKPEEPEDLEEAEETVASEPELEAKSEEMPDETKSQSQADEEESPGDMAGEEPTDTEEEAEETAVEVEEE
jgi:small subunit ribosomal protein S16